MEDYFFYNLYKLCLPNKDYFLSSLFFEKISTISQQSCVPNIALVLCSIKKKGVNCINRP